MKRRAAWLTAALVLALAAVAWLARQREAAAPQLLRQAQQALEAQRYQEAERLAGRVLSREPGSAQALLVRAAALQKLGRPQQALDDYSQLPDDGSDEALAGMCHQGALLLELGRAREAERVFRRVLAKESAGQLARAGNRRSALAFAHRRLAFLLSLEGRRWEAAPHYLALLELDDFTLDELLLLADSTLELKLPQETEKLRRSVPDDPLPLLAPARLAAKTNRLDSAEALLRQIAASNPRQAEAQAWLGWVLLERGDQPAFLAWHEGLPDTPGAEALAHPGIWLARGEFAARQGDWPAAARCFWEALQLDPHHQAACYRLSQALYSLGRGAEAARVALRSQDLARLSAAIVALSKLKTELAASPAVLDKMRETARLLETLGRTREAWAWYQAILDLDPQANWGHRHRDRLRAELHALSPGEMLQQQRAAFGDLSHLPLPGFLARPGRAAGPAGSPEAAGACRVAFVELAIQAGIDFTYFNSADPATEGARIFESTGGGVAVVDYDQDGWPDLYFTQGCAWPPQPGQSKHLDRLYRNLHDGRFQDATLPARLGDERYSQGVAAGDFDQDGFPDLFLANIGENRLYRNNGDGTFSDVTLAAGLQGERWTTTCLIADLNGDAWPDLYEVNYVEGEGVYDRVCRVEGVARACVPLAFNPQPDRLWLALGDGSFRDASEQAGILAPGGNGLGIVAADFDGSGRLSLFVANDMTPNFFFSNQSAAGNLSLVECGLAAGLAYDRDGRAQACMGVAAGDADGNGLIDLFVTNFYQEANTLYLAQPGGLYLDATREAGLYEGGYQRLGFGTQFLDGELDGLPDLVVANGHIDDFTFQGTPYHMPPQYFRNAGGGRFAEVPAASLGPYFQGHWLGRGLARCDWDRDGREEFVVSHLDSPAALLANRTPGAGHFLAVRLCGVTSSRDGIGATVAIAAGGRTHLRQLTAGDGYQASNQRQLVFGLGAATHVDGLRVRWPSGREQEFAGLAADQELLLIEDCPSPVGLPAR